MPGKSLRDEVSIGENVLFYKTVLKLTPLILLDKTKQAIRELGSSLCDTLRSNIIWSVQQCPSLFRSFHQRSISPVGSRNSLCQIDRLPRYAGVFY